MKKQYLFCALSLTALFYGTIHGGMNDDQFYELYKDVYKLQDSSCYPVTRDPDTHIRRRARRLETHCANLEATVKSLHIERKVTEQQIHSILILLSNHGYSKAVTEIREVTAQEQTRREKKYGGEEQSEREKNEQVVNEYKQCEQKQYKKLQCERAANK